MIHLLPPDALRSWHERLGGNDAFSVACKVRLPDGTRRCCVKAYPRKVALANEIIARILGREAGLPMPGEAGVLLLPERMPAFAPGWMNDRWRQETGGLAWVTSLSSGKDCACFISGFNPRGKGAKRLRKEMMEWPHLKRAIGFDDLLLNADRHGGNLIRARRGRFELIDHGRILVCPGGDGLDWVGNPAHRPRHDEPKRHPSVMRQSFDGSESEIYAASDDFDEVVERARNEVAQWLSDLSIDGDANEYLHAFLRERSSKSTRTMLYGVML